MKHIIIKLKIILQIFLVGFVTNLSAQTPGCTDHLANNYNPYATENDGSCTYNATSIAPIKSWTLPEIVNETSGLIMWNNKIVTHNDDTDINLYLLDTNDVNNYTAVPLSSCVNKDWEAISQDSAYIYIGDFGNNTHGNRTDLKILRINKASLLQSSPIIDTINFSYSSQTDFSPSVVDSTDFDCEAFIVTTDSIYLFTKQWISKRSTIYALPKTPGTYSTDSISTYNVQGLITGATYHQGKQIIVLSGYSQYLQPFFILLYDFNSANFFGGNKRKITLNPSFTQVEGITTKDGVNYFISNEKFAQDSAKLRLIDLSNYFEDFLASNTLNSPAINKIMVYPNPVSDVLNIKINTSDFSDIKLIIFNPLGEMMYSYKLNSEASKIDVSDYNNGIYYCVITKDGKSIMRNKLIKEKSD